MATFNPPQNILDHGWTMAAAVEAYFGRYRLVVNGTDIRGYWSRAQAQTAAERYPTNYQPYVRDSNER